MMIRRVSLTGIACLLILCSHDAATGGLPPDTYIVQQSVGTVGGQREPLGQSFTTVAAGQITRIFFYLQAPQPYMATLKIYKGDGEVGAPIYTQANIPLTSTTVDIILSSPLTVAAGTQYTMLMYDVSPPMSAPTYFMFSTTDTYAGGQLWGGSPVTSESTQDLKFGVMINTNVPAVSVGETQEEPQPVVVEEPVPPRRKSAPPFVSGLNQRARTYIRQIILPLLGE